jgi:hypothetical protein
VKPVSVPVKVFARNFRPSSAALASGPGDLTASKRAVVSADGGEPVVVVEVQVAHCLLLAAEIPSLSGLPWSQKPRQSISPVAEVSGAKFVSPPLLQSTYWSFHKC